MHPFIDPDDVDDREDICRQRSKPIEADAILQERSGFHQHVVRRVQSVAACQQALPFSPGIPVSVVIRIKNSVERGSIDERAHPEKSLSRYLS